METLVTIVLWCFIAYVAVEVVLPLLLVLAVFLVALLKRDPKN